MAIFEYGEYSNVYEPPDNLVDFFESSAAKYAGNPLIGEKDSAGVYHWVTYGEIAKRVDHLRAGLAALGVGVGGHRRDHCQQPQGMAHRGDCHAGTGRRLCSHV